ncbi:MAG: EscU/YscU/HrcU family type III secretion system export apparatus switch protein [Gaiella sp.]
MTRQRRKLATALAYPGEGAPKVVASGRDQVAERILEVARESGVAIHEDTLLAEALAQLELGREIPAALYQAVAEVLVWALRLDEQARKKNGTQLGAL